MICLYVFICLFESNIYQGSLSLYEMDAKKDTYTFENIKFDLCLLIVVGVFVYCVLANMAYIRWWMNLCRWFSSYVYLISMYWIQTAKLAQKIPLSIELIIHKISFKRKNLNICCIFCNLDNIFPLELIYTNKLI